MVMTLDTGPFERRLPNEDIELHFQSKNTKEENGAVIVTYQSQIPGFKSKYLSSKESMQHSAAIRLLCSIIKEPFFDELRTKQQLGYIVSSYYDINFTSRQPNLIDASSSTSNSPPLSTTSVDSIIFYVLSRKEEPAEVTNRIHDFILNFRSRLEAMSPSEIQDYAESLADSLTKPIRKLQEEAKYHFAKIRRYAPEVLANESADSAPDLGWDNPEVMATAVRQLNREDLLRVYDDVIVKKGSGAKIVSTVYGNTFPMPTGMKKTGSSCISSMEDLLAKRSTLIPFDPATNYKQQRSYVGSLWNVVGKHRTALQYVAAAAVGVGVGVWTVSSMRRSRSSNTK